MSMNERGTCSFSKNRVGHLFRWAHDSELEAELRQACRDRCLVFVLRREH